jgi:hypothetical protein
MASLTLGVDSLYRFARIEQAGMKELTPDAIARDTSAFRPCLKRRCPQARTLHHPHGVSRACASGATTGGEVCVDAETEHGPGSLLDGDHSGQILQIRVSCGIRHTTARSIDGAPRLERLVG